MAAVVKVALEQEDFQILAHLVQIYPPLKDQIMPELEMVVVHRLQETQTTTETPEVVVEVVVVVELKEAILALVVERVLVQLLMLEALDSKHHLVLVTLEVVAEVVPGMVVKPLMVIYTPVALVVLV